jgi:hypothetical protein
MSILPVGDLSTAIELGAEPTGSGTDGLDLESPLPSDSAVEGADSSESTVIEEVTAAETAGATDAIPVASEVAAPTGGADY